MTLQRPVGQGDSLDALRLARVTTLYRPGEQSTRSCSAVAWWRNKLEFMGRVKPCNFMRHGTTMVALLRTNIMEGVGKVLVYDARGRC